MVGSGLFDLFYCFELNLTVRFVCLFVCLFVCFTLPPSLSKMLFSSLSNTEFREISAHFHQHGSLFCIPMWATSHLASFLRRNFGTRSLKSENSEATYSNVSKELRNDEHMDTQTDEKKEGSYNQTDSQKCGYF